MPQSNRPRPRRPGKFAIAIKFFRLTIPVTRHDNGNHTGQYGRWAFAEFTEVYQIEADFKARVESEFNNLI
jgi:hypothetical protein